jgi:exo-beta-1,3-glucanase (GH17 family)
MVEAPRSAGGTRGSGPRGGGGAWTATRSGSSASPAATASTSTSKRVPASTTGATTLSAPSTSTPSPTTVAIGPPVSAPGSLTYTMAAGTSIKVVASNPCWIEVRAAVGGPITRVTTLQAGQTLSILSSLWMRMGNPTNVHVTAGATTLQLPDGPGDLVVGST